MIIFIDVRGLTKVEREKENRKTYESMKKISDLSTGRNEKEVMDLRIELDSPLHCGQN